MKKFVCSLMTLLILSSFSACNATVSPDETSFMAVTSDYTPADDLSEPNEFSSDSVVSKTPTEEISEPTESTVSLSGESSECSEEVSDKEPDQCEDPDDFNYFNKYADNTNNLVEYMQSVNINDIKEEASESKKELVNGYVDFITTIQNEELIYNPTYQGKVANGKDAISLFYSDYYFGDIIYYFNTDDVYIAVTVVYPNKEIKDLIKTYGVDGYRMFFNNDNKPISEYTKSELDSAGYDTLKKENITFCGEEYETVKIIKSDKPYERNVRFIYKDKIIIIAYNYTDISKMSNSDHDVILTDIGMEILNFNK